MTKTLSILIIIISFFFSQLSIANEILVGFWEESASSSLQRNDNNYLKIEFKKGKKCNIYIVSADGTSVNFQGVYYLDSKKKPMPLSIRNINNLSHPLHTIIRYVDENTIEMMRFSSTQRFRPISFSEENTISFKRIKLNN